MLKECSVYETKNAVELIAKDMLLLSAGTIDSFNAMTASWGMMGVLWGKEMLSVVIRPQRYTREFFDRSDTFCASVLAPGMAEAYRICGTKSGRDCDKIAQAGLAPLTLPGGVGFEQAQMMFVCKTLYTHDLESEKFTDEALVRANYPQRDFHRMYFGEILKCYTNA